MAGTAVTTLDDVHHVAEQVQTGLTQLLTAEYRKLPGPDLLDVTRTVEHLARLTYAIQITLAGETDLAHLAQTHGRPSTAALPRHALTISPGDARGRVRAAQAVLPPADTTTPSSTPATGTSAWPPTATPRSSRPPGSTPTNNPAATPCTESADEQTGR